MYILGQLSLIWYRLKPGEVEPGEILYVESRVTHDPRFVFEEKSLSLKNVTEDDTGKYVCQIGPNATVTHTINVRGKPCQI